MASLRPSDECVKPLNEHDDINHFNPAAHIKAVVQPYSGAVKCVCSWVGASFDMHVAAMTATYEVLSANIIEEEP